jgi:inorganic triphosphatase YgiF
MTTTPTVTNATPTNVFAALGVLRETLEACGGLGPDTAAGRAMALVEDWCAAQVQETAVQRNAVSDVAMAASIKLATARMVLAGLLQDGGVLRYHPQEREAVRAVLNVMGGAASAHAPAPAPAPARLTRPPLALRQGDQS